MAAQDNFERYFSEKIWEMIPAIYRHEDGLADNPYVLRGIVEVLARQAAILRRSQDKLWNDQSIELSDDWAVPYIAELVGTRLISALNKRGYRIDVAKTIYYRRRKGTPRILGELISDITGWEGKLVEEFKRLGRARHGLDPKPSLYAGRFSGTMPGGWADLRQPRASELTNSPFDEYHHTPDMRKHSGQNGRYNIPKLGFHLYRLKAYKVQNVTPFSHSGGLGFTFDPSGRDIPLFQPRRRAKDWDEWHSALEWEMPAPIRCRLLAHAEYLIRAVDIQDLKDRHGLSDATKLELTKLTNWHFKNESQLQIALTTLGTGITKTATQKELFDPPTPIYVPLLRLTLVEDCGKNALLPDVSKLHPTEFTPLLPFGLYVSSPLAKDILPREQITAADIPNAWALVSPAKNKRLVIDSEKGRFLFIGAAVSEVTATYHYGFSADIGAGTYSRKLIKNTKFPILEVENGVSLTAVKLNNGEGITQIKDNKTYESIDNLGAVINLTLQAANKVRPFIKLKKNWLLTGDTNAQLILDGLWIGSQGNKNWSIILKGTYDCVTIKNCTIDPGGGVNILGENLNPVPILIEGTIQKLVIDASIIATIETKTNGLVEELIICDSILQSVDPTTKAVIDLDKGKMVHIERTTILGSIKVHRLEASEVIITESSDVADTQTGCFRFSAAPSSSRLSRPYQSFLFKNEAKHWFNSRIFGRPDYAQLSETAPIEILRGAENSSEIGAFSSQINPIKMDGLSAKIEEYMPFGLIPIFINQTLKK